MGRFFLTLAGVCLLAVAGRTAEAQFGDPGFEGPPGPWEIALNDTPGATVAYDKVAPGNGFQSLKLRLLEKPATFVAVGQTLALPEGEPLPTALTFRYQASLERGMRAVVRHHAGDGRWTDLPAAELSRADGDYRSRRIDLALPAGTRALRVEFRAVGAGTGLFDEVLLDYTPPYEGDAPDTLLLVGIPLHSPLQDLCDLFYDNLRARGWKRIRAIDYENLSTAELERARLVILFSGNINLAIEGRNQDLKKALVEYVRAGGGLIITQDIQQQLARIWFRMELMKAFGGRILLEIPKVPKERQIRIGPWDHDIYAYTDEVYAPLNEGVRQVLIDVCDGRGAYDGLVPFLPTDDWKVVLAAGKGVHTVPFDKNNETDPTRESPGLGLAVYDGVCREEGFADNPPIVGIREFGKGRVAYWGIQSLFFYRDYTSKPLRPIMKAVLTDGAEGGPPSDMMVFLNHLFDWTSANSANLDRAALPRVPTQEAYNENIQTAARAEGQPLAGPLAWPVRTDRDGTKYKLYQGVIGARTTHSTGTSTPAEYVAKAKALGLDFIVFLEEMEHMDAEKYERFRAECLAFNDADFSVWCGLTFRNEYGNHQYIFSAEPLFPGRKFLTNGGKTFRGVYPAPGDIPGEKITTGSMDLEYGYTLLAFNNCIGWYRFDQSPYGPTDMRTVQSMAVFTQEDGKTLEDASDIYAMNNRIGQILVPQALTFLKNADELDRVADGTYMRAYAGYTGVAQLRANMMTHGGSSRYPNEFNYGFTGITSGPLATLDMPRGDMDPQVLYAPVLNHWPYTAQAESAAGLDLVELIDGDTVVRSWRPDGAKTFEHSGVMVNDRQRYLWLRVRDRKGKLALTRTINSNSFMLRENQCNDRENQLFYSNQPRPNPDDPPFLSLYGTDTCLPDKGPWMARIRPVGFFVFDDKLGVTSVKGLVDSSPENHPKMGVIPSIWYDGKPSQGIGWQSELVTGREGGLHCLPRRIVASSNVLVGDRVLDAVFPPEYKTVISVWGTLLPLKGPSEYVDTFGRCTLFLPKVDGIVPYLWEQDIKLLQDIPTGGGKPVVRVAHAWGSGNSTRAIVYHDGEFIGRDVERKQIGEVVDFNPGDFVLYIDPVYGSLMLTPLSEGVVLDRGGYALKSEADVIKAGTVMNVRLIGLGMHKLNPDPVALAQKIMADYGMKDGNPAYKAEFARGRIVSRQFTLELAADGYAAAGRLEGVADLAGNLGSRTSGLRDAWAAVVAIPGQMRIIPVEQGIGYAALTATEENQPLFIGHPFTTEHEGLTLGLSQQADHKTWMLEIHNPGETESVARVVNHPDFRNFVFDETVTLPAGSSKSFPLTPAAVE